MPRRGLLAALVLAVAAQTPPSAPATGSISGVVKDAASHMPMEGVRVYVGGASASTGPLGEFTLSALEPGQHWVSVYDHLLAGSGGVHVLLNAGQQLTGVEIFVKSGGAISGRVLDDEGSPVAGASVVLLKARFEFGELAYGPGLAVSTNARGEYRLEPVPAERAYLILAKMPARAGAPNHPAPAEVEKRPRVLAPAYYPASPDTAGAQPVIPGSGEDRRDIDIRMTRGAAYCIAGTVTAPKNSPAEKVTIRELFSLTSDSVFAPATAAVSEGAFRACGLHAGDYQVESAQSEGPRSGRWWAKARLSITNRDTEDVQLQATGPVTITGETAWEPAPRRESPAHVMIGLVKGWNAGNADEAGTTHSMGVMMSYGDHVAVPGPFTLENSPADDYELKIGQFPDGCYVKRAEFGGVNVLHRALRLTEAPEGRLHIALACDGASLTARVMDRDGNPVSHVNFYVMPEDIGSAAALSEVLRAAEVENGWSGMVQALAPGKYLVLASGLELDGTADPILSLWRARSKAKEIEIGPGDAAQVTLEIGDID